MLLHTVLFAVFLSTITEANLQCLYCNNAVSPIDCDTVVKCGIHERCYVDAFVSATGSIRYNLGCRDENQCGVTTIVGKREVLYKLTNKMVDVDSDTNNESSLIHLKTISSSRSHGRSWTHEISSRQSNGMLICSDCCTGNLCGSTSCGYTGYISPRGPICFNCAEQRTPEDCSKIKMCGRNEGCKDEIFKFKEIASLIGKRGKRNSLEIGGSCLVQCCKTDMCNINCTNGTNGTALNSTSTPVSTATQRKTTTMQSPGSASITIATPVIHTVAPSITGCADAISNCAAYGQTSCRAPYEQWAQQNCKAYCNLCPAFCIYKSKVYNQGDIWQDGCQYNCTCEDARRGFYRCKDLCPVWNNLPAGCTLEKKPGECCSQPNCGGTISTPGADTCYYDGNYYHQGEQWKDGCKYKCTCQDGKTGYYQCQALCLLWTLPSSCRLDPPPSGKCCQVPVCPSNVQLQYPPGFVQE